MKITLKQAYDILDSCCAVMWDDGILAYPSLGTLEKNDVFLALSMGLDDNQIIFFAGDNAEVEVIGPSLLLKDSRGKNVQISVLDTRKLESNGELI